jgi:hypothetical protein
VATRAQELLGTANLGREIVIADGGPELDLFGFDAVLTPLGFLGLLVSLEDELAVVHNLAHRRAGIGSDLDQVESAFTRESSGFIGLDNADLFAVGIDDPDWCEADIFVDPMIRLWGWFSEEFLSSSDTGPPILSEPKPGEMSRRRSQPVSKPDSCSKQVHRVQTI